MTFKEIAYLTKRRLKRLLLCAMLSSIIGGMCFCAMPTRYASTSVVTSFDIAGTTSQASIASLVQANAIDALRDAGFTADQYQVSCGSGDRANQVTIVIESVDEKSSIQAANMIAEEAADMTKQYFDALRTQYEEGLSYDDAAEYLKEIGELQDLDALSAFLHPRTMFQYIDFVVDGATTASRVGLNALEGAGVFFCIGFICSLAAFVVSQLSRAPVRGARDVNELSSVKVLNNSARPEDLKYAFVNLDLLATDEDEVTIVPLSSNTDISRLRKMLDDAWGEGRDLTKSLYTRALTDGGRYTICEPIVESPEALIASKESEFVVLAVTCWQDTRCDYLAAINEFDIIEKKIAGVMLLWPRV